MRFIAAKVSSTCIGNFFNHSSRCPSSVLFAEPDHSLAQADPERFYLFGPVGRDGASKASSSP
ncbi:hypothetical protein [Bacillus badius]|uniref:hypothetical protein n=1 Tax=Bacillus badius TaxID=1455 RepID=UPI0012E05E1C|nr:hypothetical protein [Bacillus badius]